VRMNGNATFAINSCYSELVFNGKNSFKSGTNKVGLHVFRSIETHLRYH